MPKKSPAVDKSRQGMLVSIDPASKCVGVALFSQAGELIDSWQLVTAETNWGSRLADLSVQFDELPFDNEAVSEVACELIKGSSNAAMLNCVSGIFWQWLPNVNLKATTFIPPSSWKAFIRKKTKEQGPKGLASLRLFGYKGKDISEDEADAIMVGLCYLSKRK